MGLQQYKQKRKFSRTPEPRGGSPAGAVAKGLRYVIQKHAASRLHYDFRLELEGVLKSWAVPKGPSLDPRQRSLAVHVEDHPLAYADFEGVIPAGEYGGGTVMLWDQGIWVPDTDPREQYRRGKLSFQLIGEKLRGPWTLVRMSGRGGEAGEAKNWLLIKREDGDATAERGFDPRNETSKSVRTGRAMEQIAAEADAVWSGGDATSTAVSPAASELPKARKAKQPESFQPQLPTLVQEPPISEGWLHELKLDGYRILIVLRDGTATLLTRNGNDWTERFAAIAKEAERLPIADAVLDGEVVSLRPDGTTDFQSLQNALRHNRVGELVYFAFDLPWCSGYDLQRVPLRERKGLLRRCLEAANGIEHLRFTDHIDSRGKAVFEHACQHALEGIVSKRADSGYRQGRSRSWVKVKCLQRQEFVIGGYSAPRGSRKFFGALLLGYYDDQRGLVYCGRVGSGFTSDSLQTIGERLQRRKSRFCPFDEPPERAESLDVTWVAPELVVEVGFSQWTEEGRLRHASFQGLRGDKRPYEVTREQPMTAPSKNKGRVMEGNDGSRHAPPETYSGVHLSNPGRVLYPEQGCTKQNLADYYAQAADWMLPDLAGRPLTLVRCPRGRSGECFYQKHMTESFPDSIPGITVNGEDGVVHTYVSVDEEAGLIALVQMGVLEVHPWSARADRLDCPDRLIFDLDPHETVSWNSLVDAAHELRELLATLGLISFVRTTGGKGLHVVVPIVRRSPWKEAKQFTRDVADAMVRHDPQRYIATASKAKRRSKIFIDYLRNARGATAIASYSTRARKGATVATPLSWEELTPDLRPDAFNIKTVAQRLRRQQQNAWKGFEGVQQSITRAATRVLRKRSA